MTDSDLRELDGWIAEHFFGKTICPGEYDHILTEDNLVLLAPNYSSDPSSFALVKREIERRGWSWRCEYPFLSSTKFMFEIFRPGVEFSNRYAAASEELAGCLAVKAAVDAISSSIPT